MPRSITIVGWSIIITSFITILLELSNFFSDPIQEFNLLIQAFPRNQFSIEPIIKIFQYFRIWSIYAIIFFIFVLIGAILFIQLRAAGRNILEIACWTAIANGCIDTCLNYILWQAMSKALSNVVSAAGISLGQIYPLRNIALIMGLFLWIIPSIGLIFYLRNPKIKILMK
ncbi:MAG: hypothetical protein JXA06_12130 [Bacteroidetes bacterium]|nr:hypothetical protein [Bacteroidota bacterium]